MLLYHCRNIQIRNKPNDFSWTMKTEGKCIKLPLKYWFLCFVLFAIYLINLHFNLVIDAGKYATVSKEIFETGNWIHLKVLGMPYDQKPPFMFWLGALSFHLFGVSNWAFKLPTLLFTLGGTYSIYRLGSLLYGTKTGVLSAIMLLTSQAAILYNNDTHTDMILTMCIVFATWQLYRFVEENNKWAYVFGFVGVGLAMMTKGPIGLVIPCFSLLSHVLVRKKYRLLLPWIWLPGLLILSIFLIPTLVGLYDQFGTDGVKFYFWTNNAGRIDGSYAGHQHDYFFCFHTILYLLLPFSLLLYFGVFQEIKQWVRSKFSTNVLREGITLGAPIYLLIVSFAKQQSPQYMLPVIPLLLIITAKWTTKIIDNISQKTHFKWLIVVQNLLLILLCLLSFLVSLYVFPTRSLRVWIPLWLMAVFVIYFLWTAKTDTDKVIGIPLVAVLMLNLVLSLHFFPEVFKYDATAIASTDFNRLSGRKAVLSSFPSIDVEFGFYAKKNGGFIHDANDEALKSSPDPWLYADKTLTDAILKKYPEASIIKSYKYKKISQLNMKFLNPATREETLKDRFLIKIKK